MAATVPVETEGAVNALLESAKQIGEPADAKTETAAQPAQQNTTDPQVGSFERFMSSFGSPGRWAGR